MSFMEAALEGYKAPEADDMEIVLPPRREPKKEPAAAEPRDLGPARRRSGRFAGGK